ncbi:unnamed protein product, partial [Tetraodon nigroviridis]
CYSQLWMKPSTPENTIHVWLKEIFLVMSERLVTETSSFLIDHCGRISQVRSKVRI